MKTIYHDSTAEEIRAFVIEFSKAIDRLPVYAWGNLQDETNAFFDKAMKIICEE